MQMAGKMELAISQNWTGERPINHRFHGFKVEALHPKSAF